MADILDFKAKSSVARVTPAERLEEWAKEAREHPEKFKCMLILSADTQLADYDWALAGEVNFINLLGLIEVVKMDLVNLSEAINYE